MRRFMRFLFLTLVMAALAVHLTGCPAAARRPGREPTISLYVNETGETKRIGLEEYLQGVVAAEMEPGWPVNALAAQAILARTFTLKKMQEGGVKAHGTDASTSVEEFQAYDPSRVNDNVRRAVQITRGQAVTYRGRYINAWFHADGGGRTAASAMEGLAFNKEPTPYIKSVRDPGFAITTPENRAWKASFAWSEMRRAVKEATGQDPGATPRVTIRERGPSGRVTSLQVGNVAVSGPALRLALGSDRMRSTLLESLGVQGQQVIMQGKGYGHGVGMSQWGARALAQQGRKPADIVRYFFRGVKVEKRW